MLIFGVLLGCFVAMVSSSAQGWLSKVPGHRYLEAVRATWAVRITYAHELSTLDMLSGAVWNGLQVLSASTAASASSLMPSLPSMASMPSLPAATQMLGLSI